MRDATQGENANISAIDWRMSASLADVPRGDSEVAEVTNLLRAVQDWCALDARHREAAVLTTEHPVRIDGTFGKMFAGAKIAALADRFPVRFPTAG